MIKSPLFWIGLLCRILLLPVVISDYPSQLILQFIDASVTDFLSNPWSKFPIHYFPYGTAQYAIMVIPKLFFYMAVGSKALGLTPLSLAIYKLPILLGDIAFLGLLRRYPFQKNNSIYYFFWLNPILIYISYVHGQLDLFSILFLMAALYSLMFDNEKWSAFALAIAILCKFQVFAVFPIFCVFIWTRYFKAEAILRLLIFCSITLVIVFMGFIPHILSSNFGYVSVLSPEAKGIFSLSWGMGRNREILIGFCLLVLLHLRLLLSTRVTWQGLLYATSIVLGALVLVTSPMPGWYFWLYPFLALFCAQYVTRLPIAIIMSFLFYFLTFVLSDRGIDIPHLITSVSFSLLQTSILIFLIVIWFFVIKNEMPWFRRMRPLLVGIAGNSGAGKDTISGVLSDLFGHTNVSIVEGDDYHRWERSDQRWNDYTHLNPKANFLERLSKHILMLTQGQSLYKSNYDHSSGSFTEERLLNWEKNIIVQGLHTLYPIVMRNLFDIRIFIRPNESLRRFWKVKRDFTERGHALDKVINSIIKREKDSKTHIDPQCRFADWIIEYHPVREQELRLEGRESDLADIKQDIPLYQLNYIINDTPIESLLAELSVIPTLSVQSEPHSDNIDFIRVRFEGTISSENVGAIAKRVFRSVRYLTCSSRRPDWRSDYEGINQLIFLALICRSEGYFDFYRT